MPHPKHRLASRSARKVPIKIKQSVRITRKQDSARVDSSKVSRPDTLKKAPTEIPSNGVVFRVKVKKK